MTSNHFLIGIDINMKDALGKEIILGNKYGYARQEYGSNTVVIGKARNFTKTGLCTLVVLERKESVYLDELQLIAINSSTTSVKPFMLFPIL